MRISVETIPHDQQRYDTAGDWRWKDNDLIVSVSDLGDWEYEALVAIHEIIEAVLCRRAGITTDEVDEFDMAVEQITGISSLEPGDMPDAPYGEEHSIATGVERILAARMEIPWILYEGKIDDLGQE